MTPTRDVQYAAQSTSTSGTERNGTSMKTRHSRVHCKHGIHDWGEATLTLKSDSIGVTDVKVDVIACSVCGNIKDWTQVE